MNDILLFLVTIIPLLGIGEDGVGLRDLLEPRLRFRRTVPVGVVLGQLPVRCLDIFTRSRLRDAKDDLEVPLDHLVMYTMVYSSVYIQRSSSSIPRCYITNLHRVTC